MLRWSLAILLLLGALASANDAKTRKRDLTALLEHLDKECKLLKEKKINWRGVSAEARKRLRKVSSDVEFYGLVVWVVGQLRDSHAGVMPKDKALSEKWWKAQPERLQVPMGLMPGAHGLVLVSSPGKTMRDRGVEVGMVLSTVDGKDAAEWLEARAKERFQDGHLSTMHRARTITYSYGIEVAKGKRVKLALRKLALSDANRTKYLKSSPKSRARMLRKATSWDDRNVGVSSSDCRPAKYMGHGFPQWEVQGLQKAGERTSYAVLPSGLGYINLWKVDGETQPAEIDKALQALAECPGLVVDMRWNGGGGGEHKVAACFPGGNKSDAPTKWTKPVAVLIGPRVMSSGDSVAHFLKTWFRHPLYGQNTSGASGPKGRFELPSGFASIRFVNKHWKSRRLEGYGVAPEHEVLQDVVELAEGIDSVRAAAERYLEKQAAR